MADNTYETYYYYMPLKEVLRLIPVSKSTWLKGCATGRFPQGYRLAPGMTAWRSIDIEKCLASFPKEA